MFEVVSVSKSFGGLVAVHDASLTVRAGEIVACVGPNGAGKTTLLNMMSGWLAPTRGVIQFRKQRLASSPLICAKAGIVRTFQTPRLFLKLTVLENILLATTPTTSEGLFTALFRRSLLAASEGSSRSTALTTLEAMGLSHLSDRVCHSLSAGERRLVDLCSAIARKPQCLLLDEPTVGLSAAARTLLAKMLLELKATVPVFIVEHDLDFVEEVADRIVVVSMGRVIADGPIGGEMTNVVERAYAS